MQAISSSQSCSLPTPPVELTDVELHLVAGGLPKGTWVSLLGLPKGGWSESNPGDSLQSGLPKGTW